MSDKKPTLADGLNSPVKYDSNKVPVIPSVPGNEKQKSPEEMAKEFEKLKAKLEDLKKKIVNKHKFVRFLSILPQQMLPLYAEDEAMPKEVEETKPLLLFMCIPEDNYKDLPKIKPEIIEMIKETKQNIWLIVKTEVDIWSYGLDSKFELIDGISNSFPLHDGGFLGSLRVANIHKALVLRKFEKYITSYVIGGSLVRGVAGKDSDVDTFIIIDDTDVKRMPRLELKEKLRGMIYDYIREASALAGVQNILNVQVYLLTEFWESVKDAQPVMFTFIRDGVPLYDRGTFIPWKLLLKMGRIKPSPEAIDLFMKSGDQTVELVKRRLMDAMVDIYWGILTPTQALLMLAGHAPPEPKIVVSEVKKVLVDREKLMTMKELKILERSVKLYKDYEHGKLTEISGTEIDQLRKDSNEYTKRMKVLKDELELRMREHTVDKIHDEVFTVLKNIFGTKSSDLLVKDLEEQLVKKGKIQKRMLNIAREIADIKKKSKNKKLTHTEQQKISGEGSELLNALTEYAQRKDLVALEKGIIQITSKDRKAELATTDSGIFVVEKRGIRKISGKRIDNSDAKAFEDALKNTKERLKGKLSQETLDVLKKEFGEFSVEF